MFDKYPTLFVTWRSPRSRLIHPVGKLSFDFGLNLYEFHYIQAAEKARSDGFMPFLEFPSLESQYRSKELFPLFSNRVMPKSRPDFKPFLAALGIAEDAPHPLTILARSGGKRETDQVELFPVPTETEEEGCYATFFLLRSIQYMPKPMTEERIARLVNGEELFLKPDLQNPVDPNAIGVYTTDDVMLGFLPSYLTKDVALLSENCCKVSVYVDHVNPPPAEAHHRLLCRFVSCWPDGFQPYSGEEYQPYRRLAAV